MSYFGEKCKSEPDHIRIGTHTFNFPHCICTLLLIVLPNTPDIWICHQTDMIDCCTGYFPNKVEPGLCKKCLHDIQFPDKESKLQCIGCGAIASQMKGDKCGRCKLLELQTQATVDVLQLYFYIYKPLSQPLHCWDQIGYTVVNYQIRSTLALISTATLKTEKNSTTTASNSPVPTLITPSPRYFWEGDNSIILPSNPALLRSHFLCLAFSHLSFSGPEFSTSTVPSPDLTHAPLPLSVPPSAIPTACPSPTLAPNPSPLPVSPAPLSPVASPITDIDMSSAALENLLQALVNNQNQLQQAMTNLVNRPTHEYSDKTPKPAPFKGKPAKLDSFWAGEQKRLKLDTGKLNPQKLMIEGPAAEWAAEYSSYQQSPSRRGWSSLSLGTHPLKVRFRVANEQKLAKNKLEALKQGDKTVTEFSQMFKMWAEKTGFSDQDLQYKFWKCLHKDLLFPSANVELGQKEAPKNLDELINQALHVEQTLAEFVGKPVTGPTPSLSKFPSS
ncbi:hypothetical protein D9758_010860 [Tetrapyrgos nigripes]|uniref:Retrotransposon gag domain-containing protein n=1 Tax=Tetrapyrgos nigripes TaxID=182062 RepID=A0A8H5GIG5_9AGAR|nr:hypothetical protein D9758_010860 [Tetrapyrgos nigripes]